MQTNLYCFLVWYVITCHLTTYRASRNRFSAIIFHDCLHIFLARFLITNTEFTDSIKVGVDVDVSEMPLQHAQYSRNNWQLCTWAMSFIFLTDMCSFWWEKCEPRPKLFLRLDIFSRFRGVHTLIFTYVPYIVIGLHEEPAPQTHTHTHTHTNKKDTVCLMTSTHPTSSPHNLFSNSHHDEYTSFLSHNCPKIKKKFIPKVLKVHINRIQLYLYSASPRNQCKLKP